MKFWYEAELEKDDKEITCCKCGGKSNPPEHVFCEVELKGGAAPNPDELHPEPTGRMMCPKCCDKGLREWR